MKISETELPNSLEANNNDSDELNENLYPENEGVKVYDIRERTLNFGIRIMEIQREIPTITLYNSVRSQIIKSGTAIGANLAEGDGAKTKKDFVNKLVISRKEAKEVKYWLRLLNG